jgi:hypothetical protein
MERAESCSKLLMFILNALGASARQVESGGDTIAERSSGLYMLWLMTVDGERELVPWFPAYVGHTARPLADRIQEHITRGKILEIFQGLPGGVRTVDCVQVVYVPTSGVSAATLEAVFLSKFDFVLNTVLNGTPRTVDPTSAQEAGDDTSECAFDSHASEVVTIFREALSEVSSEAARWESLLSRAMGRV